MGTMGGFILPIFPSLTRGKMQGGSFTIMNKYSYVLLNPPLSPHLESLEPVFSADRVYNTI